jgi:hypothetical protein
VWNKNLKLVIITEEESICHLASSPCCCQDKGVTIIIRISIIFSITTSTTTGNQAFVCSQRLLEAMQLACSFGCTYTLTLDGA